MEVHSERRTGNERRQLQRGSSVGTGKEAQWRNADDDEPFETYDPYWEPHKGQDDD